VPPEKFGKTMLSVNLHQATLRALVGFKELNLIDQAIRAEFYGNLDEHKGGLAFIPAFDSRMMPHMVNRTFVDTDQEN
jgi:hypothetical protein